MTVNSLLLKIIQQVNDELVQIMDNPDYEALIGNDITDDMTIDNYVEQSEEYLRAVEKLILDGKSVKIFLKKTLMVLSKIKIVEDDFEITTNSKTCSVKSELFDSIYINNNIIESIFLDKNKVIIIPISYQSFESFISNYIREDDTVMNELIYITKALSDNFNYIKEQELNRIVFLSNCTIPDIQNYNDNKSELVAYIKLCLLADGKSFHKHFEATQSITSHIIQCDSTKNYIQYNEILYVLSEYNNSKDLLNKYFLLYTIIENFMYRKPIAQMMRSTDEFSIRDFKRFYSQIDGGEAKKIGSLFFEVLDIGYEGDKFAKLIYQELDSFAATDTGHKLIDFLKKIGVSNRDGNMDYTLLLNDQNSYTSLRGKPKESGYFAKIVYSLRNSILHNTATEFHITHYELSKNQIIADFLQQVMIPILEKIILHLIFTNNQLISYDEKSLILYKS